MKKLVLSLAMLTGMTVTANAQVTFGVKAGGTLSTQRFDNDSQNDRTKYKFGGHGGAFANFGITDMFSVQPELLFSMKGAEVEQDFTAGGNTYQNVFTESMNYIDVPVMVKVSTGEDHSGLFFEAGPQVGFLLSANVDTKTTAPTGTAGSQSGSADTKDRYNTVDFGYAVGLGYQLESGPLVGLRYNGGITNFVKTGTATVRNDAFQLYVGYRLGGN